MTVDAHLHSYIYLINILITPIYSALYQVVYSVVPGVLPYQFTDVPVYWWGTSTQCVIPVHCYQHQYTAAVLLKYLVCHAHRHIGVLEDQEDAEQRRRSSHWRPKRLLRRDGRPLLQSQNSGTSRRSAPHGSREAKITAWQGVSNPRTLFDATPGISFGGVALFGRIKPVDHPRFALLYPTMRDADSFSKLRKM